MLIIGARTVLATRKDDDWQTDSRNVTHFVSTYTRKTSDYTQRQTTLFLRKQTWSAVKGCYIWLDSLDPLQQRLGGQPFQQATVTLKFKMASNMADIFLNTHIFNNCYYIFMHTVIHHDTA